MIFHIINQRGFLQLFLPGLFICVLFAAGCAKIATTESDYSADWNPEEVAPSPYVPPDDGDPLSRNEVIAMSYKSGFLGSLSDKDEQEVELHFKYFARRGRETFERYLLRAERYLPYVDRIFREKGIPPDVAYLAIVESGFNPNAVSRAGATGMWQFMPRTGDIFGLERNWWIDERRDPYKSTIAAADYLTKLYNDFGDWFLALAAYNAGEGKIGRALDSTGAEDFFELCNLNDRLHGKAKLKEETRKYVPKFIAVVRIMHNLPRLGFQRLDFSKWEEPEHVVVAGGTDLRGLATAAGVSWEEFVEMNPAPQRQATSPGSQVSVHLPKRVMPQATAYLGSEKSRSYAGWTSYTIRKGDTVAKISKKSGVPAREILSVNKLDPKRLRVGQTILIPGSSMRNVQAMTSSGSGGNKGGNKPAAASGGVYKVRSGDTLYSIARKHNTSIKSLCAVNNLSEKSRLSIGQRLAIPGNRPSQAEAPKNAQVLAARSSYTVKSGDTMWSIARKHNVSPVALLELNKMTKKSKIKIGQKIKIP